MIINFTRAKDKYISEYIAEVTGDEIVDAKQKISEKDKTPLFSEKPYVLVCDYTMLLNFRNLINMGRGKFNGSKIFYCVFVINDKRSFPLAMAKNVASAKGMVLFGCEAFKMLKADEPDKNNILKIKEMSANIRDCIPLEHKKLSFPLRTLNSENS